MKNKIRLVTTFLLLTLCGCHFVPSEEVYNNTQGDLVVTTVTQFGRDLRTNTLSIKKGESVLVGVAIKLEIQEQNATRRYQIERIPYEFYEGVGGNRRIAKLQIQEDGSIYLLLPGSATPVTTFPPQPTGFPLRPNEPYVLGGNWSTAGER